MLCPGPLDRGPVHTLAFIVSLRVRLEFNQLALVQSRSWHRAVDDLRPRALGEFEVISISLLQYEYMTPCHVTCSVTFYRTSMSLVCCNLTSLTSS